MLKSTINYDSHHLYILELNLKEESTEIIIHAEETDGRVKISVTDQGNGIPQEYIPRLFERYFRIDKNESQASGMGFGLYISLEIIRKPAGDMGLDTELGKGTTFWFTLPQNRT